MKLPWQKFFPSDWLSDEQLSICSPATRGVYMDFVAHMLKAWCGQVQGTRDQLARLGRCTPDQVTSALDELRSTGAATVTERNGVVTVVCRRLEKEEIARKKGCERVRRFRVTADVTPQKQKCNLSDSRSGSESGLGSGGECRGEVEAVIPTVEEVQAFCQGRDVQSPPALIPSDYAAYYHAKKREDNGWIKGGMLIRWRDQIARWWAMDMMQWEAGTHPGQRKVAPVSRFAPRPPTITELKTQKEVLEGQLSALRCAHGEGPLARPWSDDDKLKRADLKKRIAAILEQIAKGI